MSASDEVRHEKITPLEIAFRDERGEITNIIQGEDIEHVALITSKKGSIRARHFHPKGNTQRMFCVIGKYIVTTQEVTPDGKLVPGTRRVALVQAGDLTEVPPLTAHGYYFLSEESIALNINTKKREPHGYGQHTIFCPALRVATSLEDADVG